MAAQSSKSMAGVIIMAGAIVTGAIIMAGAIIAIGETSLPNGNLSGRSRLSLAAFSFERSYLGHGPTQKPPRFPSTACAVALRLPGGLQRRAVLERSPSLPSHRTQCLHGMGIPMRCQLCRGQRIPDDL
jgi:hypothetical protein